MSLVWMLRLAQNFEIHRASLFQAVPKKILYIGKYLSQVVTLQTLNLVAGEAIGFIFYLKHPMLLGGF